MKTLDSRILIGVIAVLTAGLIGVIGTSSTPLAIGASTINGFQDGSGMLGHVTLVATDANGDIKSYQQLDNLITRVGVNCLAHTLFESTEVAGGSVTCGGDPGLFNVIAIGEGNGQNDQSTGLATESLVAGLTPDTDTSVLVVDDGDGNGATAQVEVTFTSGAGTTSITEAGIFNNTATGTPAQMMSYRDFTSISLDSGDSLTVTWTITLDGT